MKKYFIIWLMAWLSAGMVRAHEPLYGFGPHVLYKNGFAPHLTLNWSGSAFETEYALGYGITRSWTLIAESPWKLENGRYQYDGFNLKSKYRFWLKTRRGASFQSSFISKIDFPAGNGQPTVLNLALTAGQEALKLYWFATGGYAMKFTGDTLKPGNQWQWNISIGYRPHRVDYYKPDVVFFLETTGNHFRKSFLNGDKIAQSGGSNLAVAPTFFFTYRNFAFRGGVQFGIWNNKFADKPETNYKMTIELHI